MAESVPLTATAPSRPWDARLARWLVTPLKDTSITPNHLTSVRLAVGICAAAAFTPGTYGWSNAAALLLVLSNFLDHTDGELARISGKGSRIGHYYDLASDALITVAFFAAIGVGVGTTKSFATAAIQSPFAVSPTTLGAVAGIAVAIIFLLRLRIENLAGKAGTRQPSWLGFETEDVLYLLPLVTLCNGLASFLTLASIGAPLFAIWVTIDYRRTLSRQQSGTQLIAAQGEFINTSSSQNTTQQLLAERIANFDLQQIRASYVEQGAFLSLPAFVGPPIVEQLIAAVNSARPSINRNYIPGHKQGGSVSRFTLDQVAPFIGELYRSACLVEWLSQLAGESLQPSPADDSHAYALYFYTNTGDHIGWHYDTSYYAGRRYTVLLGVIDQASCRLEYKLHTREAGAAVQSGSIQMAPGDLVFFDGDKLRHRITPLGKGELRVSLTLEYVTDPSMHPWWRFVSNMKDALAYFGFRQVFRRIVGRAPR